MIFVLLLLIGFNQVEQYSNVLVLGNKNKFSWFGKLIKKIIYLLNTWNLLVEETINLICIRSFNVVLEEKHFAIQFHLVFILDVSCQKLMFNLKTRANLFRIQWEIHQKLHLHQCTKQWNISIFVLLKWKARLKNLAGSVVIAFVCFYCYCWL